MNLNILETLGLVTEQPAYPRDIMAAVADTTMRAAVNVDNVPALDVPASEA